MPLFNSSKKNERTGNNQLLNEDNIPIGKQTVKNRLSNSSSKNLKFLSAILRHSKIQIRLIVSFMLLCILAIAVNGFTSYNNSSQAVHSKIATYSVQVTNQVSKNVSIELSKYKNAANEMMFADWAQNSLGTYDELSDAEKETVLKDYKSAVSSRFMSIITNLNDTLLVINNSSKTMFSSSNTNSAAVSSAEKFWPIDRVKALTAEAEKDPTKGLLTLEKLQNTGDYGYSAVTTKAIKSKFRNQIIGYFVMAIKGKYLTSIYSNIDLGEDSKIFLMDSKGTVVSSTNTDAIGRPFAEKSLLDNLLKKKDALNNTNSNTEKTGFQNFNLSISGKEHLVAYSPIEDTDWYVVTTIPATYLYKETNNILFSIVIVGILCLLAALILSFVISRTISIPLKRMVETMKIAEEGDLSISVDDTSRDELGQVTRDFNSMLVKISALISKVRQSSQKVLSNAKNIAASARQSYVSTEQISMTIGHVAKGASEQAIDIAESVEHIGRLSEGINKVNEDIDSVSGVIHSTKDLSEEALVIVKALNNKAVESNSASDEIITNVNKLNSEMKEIQSIVGVIGSIAEQTNLLALNAAIEAARAGAAGKGFAVVADRVKKLAEQSKGYSTTINNIIGNIMRNVDATADSANKSRQIIKEQLTAMDETNNAFRTIYNSMENMSNNIRHVEGSVKEILQSKDKALESMQNISAVSQETAATSQEVSASTHEQFYNAEQLSKLAEELNSMSQELDTVISKFKISDFEHE